MKDENEIVEKILSGDKDSFRLIVEKYQSIIFSTCYQMVKDRFEAENLTQDTFITVYKSLSGYRFQGFKTWITRIAINKCLDYRRQMAKCKENPVSPEDLPEVGHDPPAEDVFMVKADTQTVLKLCNQMAPIYQDVINQYYIHSKTIREIAIEEGICEKTIETRLYRGIKMLNQMWKEEHP